MLKKAHLHETKNKLQVSVFGGPAWTWRDERQAYYFHQFAPEQPDLNYHNEVLINEMKVAPNISRLIILFQSSYMASEII